MGPMLELEGTWEEILAHADELTGRRVRLIVLPAQSEAETRQPSVPPGDPQLLDLLTEWERTPLTNEERDVLDGLEQHLKESPFPLRQLEDAS